MSVLDPVYDIDSSDEPEDSETIKFIKSTFKNLCCHEAKHMITILLLFISIIPIVSSTLQLILIFKSICSNNTPETIILSSITLILFSLSLLLINKTNGKFSNISNKSSISTLTLLFIIILYLFQYSLIIHTFKYYINYCSTHLLITNISYYLLLSWIMIYSAIFISLMIGISCKINKSSSEWGNKGELLVLICALFCQLGIVLIPSILQIILIKIANCNGSELISLLETICLPIITFVGTILGIVMITTKDSVLFSLCLFLLFITFCFVLHSCYVWSDTNINCGDYNYMKTAVFVFFIILGVEYGIITIATCCFGFIYRIPLWGDD